MCVYAQGVFAIEGGRAAAVHPLESDCVVYGRRWRGMRERQPVVEGGSIKEGKRGGRVQWVKWWCCRAEAVLQAASRADVPRLESKWSRWRAPWRPSLWPPATHRVRLVSACFRDPHARAFGHAACILSQVMFVQSSLFSQVMFVQPRLVCSVKSLSCKLSFGRVRRFAA